MRHGECISYLAVFLLIGSSLSAQDLDPPDDKEYTIGDILLEKHTIFDAEEGSSFFHRAANALHVVTQDKVIQREFLFKKGDPYRASLLEETERNLRQLGFIAEANILVEFHQNQIVTVTVSVRDKFSLSVGASGGFSGGESTLRFLLGESNFLGTGIDVDAQYVYSEEESGIGLSYFDPRFLNSRHEVFASIDLLDDREKYQIGAKRPFFSLETLWSWGGVALYQESHSVYYQAGEEVNRVPTEMFGGEAFLQRAWGDRTLRVKLGPKLFFSAPGYSQPLPEDVVAGYELAIPTDRHIVGVALATSFDWFPEYIERKELDAIDFVEDLALGVSVGLSLGLSYWDMEGNHGPRFPLEVNFVSTFEPAEDQIATLLTSATFRRGNGETEAWGLSSAAHYYYSGLPSQTLALSLSFNAGKDSLDLPVQFTLGENSGLRGYDARYFEGDRRLRLNFEDRIFTPLELFTLRLGVVAFFDAGYAWDSSQGFQWDDLKTSAGFGFRIGSARFFQGSVLRIDIAFPFDEEGSDGVSISVTTGQVFTLYSNPDKLTLRW